MKVDFILIYIAYLSFIELVTSKMLKIDSSEAGASSYWQCTDCDYRSPHCGTIKRHIECKHVVSAGYNCPDCGKYVPTRNALRVHHHRYHQ